MKYNFCLHLINNGYAAIGAILLSNKFELVTIIFELLVFFIVILSFIMLVNEICNKLKNKEKILLLNGKIIPKNLRYILCDYTVIITMIFTSLLFAATEIILKTL